MNQKSSSAFSYNFSINSRYTKTSKTNMSNRSKILHSRNETFDEFKESHEDNSILYI